ncbi:MAG: pyridoxine 5'-phosphate synthase [Alistipes sp.]|nr:pyridoxine 5'-phosphate synthase [Candidatus Alistipes equi]
MTKLSVNVNKVAVLRNSRGGNIPCVLNVARDIETFGADGITVHPRPDARHIRYSDVYDLKANLRTELNIEGNPIPSFIDLVLNVVPSQVTLVPDAADAITSSAGWDVKQNFDFLKDVTETFKQKGIRVSIFVDASEAQVEEASRVGADRVELYTEAYASGYTSSPEKAIEKYLRAAQVARECSLGLNAGHDLSLVNLKYFHDIIPWCDEVSIGHALISDALYLGLKETITRYKRCLDE